MTGGAGRFFGSKSTPLRSVKYSSAPPRSVPRSQAPCRSAASRFAPARSACSRAAPTRCAPTRFAPLRFVLCRSAPLKLAPVKSASLRSSWLRFAPPRSAEVSSARAPVPGFFAAASQTLCFARIASRSVLDFAQPWASFQVHSVCCCPEARRGGERQSKAVNKSPLDVPHGLIGLP
jgi:hypothetical protein